MNIRECCDGMKTMLSENTFAISNISQKGWLKVIEHDGTMQLGENPRLHNYDITHCPFCGLYIKGQSADPFNKTD
jgi:hypothetical protein